VYTRASPTDILARKSAHRTKVCGLCRRAERAARAAAGRVPRENPREEVGEEVRVGVGVRVGPVEFKLNYTQRAARYGRFCVRQRRAGYQR